MDHDYIFVPDPGLGHEQPPIQKFTVNNHVFARQKIEQERDKGGDLYVKIRSSVTDEKVS